MQLLGKKKAASSSLAVGSKFSRASFNGRTPLCHSGDEGSIPSARTKLGANLFIPRFRWKETPPVTDKSVILRIAEMALTAKKSEQEIKINRLVSSEAADCEVLV